jgi:hypothetical protein
VELSKLCLSLLGLIGLRSSQALGETWDKRGRGVQFKYSPFYVLVFLSLRPKGQVQHESNLALGDFKTFFHPPKDLFIHNLDVTLSIHFPFDQ